jgi:hypothetical protein
MADVHRIGFTQLPTGGGAGGGPYRVKYEERNSGEAGD